MAYDDDFEFAMRVHRAAESEMIVARIRDLNEREKHRKLAEKSKSSDDEQHVKVIIEDSGRVSCVQYAQEDEEQRSL